ncbi:MAG: methionine/alanine import family NSS transporter small subunit [Actinomyces sp.]|nr:MULTISPECIES: methionine/alanine import family NSS transporter small subunit [Actinomycetaceae]MBS5826318.1 methionine/alanine import family NSS transporter small subunit [Actinomyces sp.]MDU4832317.1 methionine/alanine import family NSS transporter small subunit [Actinomyces sp.]MDU5568138.1 methionine/alanine import family NSS transporter small subunit [Actinomyces sp.]WIK63613.1 methionine/alanine import family NSS transporter small subunit [Gleimia europaea]
MEPASIILMVLTILVVWGGLVASVVALQRSDIPEPEIEGEPTGALTD